MARRTKRIKTSFYIDPQDAIELKKISEDVPVSRLFRKAIKRIHRRVQEDDRRRIANPPTSIRTGNVWPRSFERSSPVLTSGSVSRSRDQTSYFEPRCVHCGQR